MDIRKKILKIAEKILADVHFSTQKEFDEYLKNHPDYREDTKFFVNGVQVKAPPKEKKNDSSEMTDEQKKLHDMINDPDESVRESVATNPNTHPYTLHKMSDDESSSIRRRIIVNPNITPMTLQKLGDDESSYVRKNVASHPKTPEETLRKLCEDEDLEVRGGILKNPKTSPETIKNIAEKFYGKQNPRDVDAVFFKKDIAESPNTPVEVLEKLCEDNDAHFEVYVSLLNRPMEVKKRILKKLSEGNDERMKKIADYHLKKIEENEKMVYDSEYDQYLTMDEVKKEYESLKESGETEAENFDDYLENITGKNGTCKIVKKQDN